MIERKEEDCFQNKDSPNSMKYIKRKLPPVNLLNGRRNTETFYSRYRDLVLLEQPEEETNVIHEEKQQEEAPLGISKRLSFLDKKTEKPPKGIPFLNKKSKTSSGKRKKDINFPKKKKEKLPSPRFVTDEQLTEMGYPKTYFDPTDEEIDKDGVPNYYFNINKTFEKLHWEKLAQKLPMDKLDKLTYDKPFLDKYAVKQHEKVVKMNSLEPKEQYKKDIQAKNNKKYILCGGIVGLLCLIFMVIVPNIQFSMGMSAFEKGNYEDAKNLFSLAGSSNGADIYAYYCAAKVNVMEKNYDDAKEKINKLIDGKYKIEGVDMNDELLDVDYQKAMAYYSSGDYNNAKKTFYSVVDYSDAKDYYYKCGYKLGSDYYENGKPIEALREFFYVKNYSDSKERIEEIAGSIYDDGMLLYDKGKFADAAAEFAKIADYNFKDASAMEQQCTYKNGINSISASQYEEAINILKPLGVYKDSLALLNEAYYRLGNNLFLETPAESIKYYSLIPFYRDVENKLLLPQLILYGSWEVTEMDNVSQSDLSFSFDASGNFITKNNLNNIAISTEAMAHPYIWANDMFVSDSYTIKINIKDYDNIELTCSNLGKETNYRCKRTSMLGQNAQSSTLDETNPFDKDTLQYYLQEYINEKTDAIIVLNNKKYTLEELLDRKTLTESTPSEAKN